MPTSVTYTPDSKAVLVTLDGPYGSEDRAIMIDLATGKIGAQFTKHTHTVSCGTLSRDGSLAATAGGDDSETYVWKVADGSVVQRGASKGHCVVSCGWSRDGNTIAWGNTTRYAGINNRGPIERAFRIDILDFVAVGNESYRQAQEKRGSLELLCSREDEVIARRTGRDTLNAKVDLGNGVVNAFSLLLDDTIVIGGSGLKLFETRTGRLVTIFRGDIGQVWAVAPSPDGRYLLSASSDKTVRIWDRDCGDPLLSFFFAGDEWVAWTAEGYYAASPGGERLFGWHVDNGSDKMASYYPAAQFRPTFYRPDVIKLLLKAGSTEKALAMADAARSRPAVSTSGGGRSR